MSGETPKPEVPQTAQEEPSKVFKIFRFWETKYALTFMGFVVGVLGFAFGLWVYLQRTTPNLKIEVTSNANVIDVKEDVGKIEIIYEGVNLRETQQTLALVTLKISNDGAAPIRKSDYDDKAPLGIAITNGNIAKVELFGPSNAYLRGQMKATVVTNLWVIFPENTGVGGRYATTAVIDPIILEPGDFFWMKVLILHNEKSGFDIMPVGKIAGVKAISFKPLNINETPVSSWKKALSGNIEVQAQRLIVYAFGGIVVLFVSVMVSITKERRRERKTKAREKAARTLEMEKFRVANAEMASKYSTVLVFYLEWGKPALISVPLAGAGMESKAQYFIHDTLIGYGARFDPYGALQLPDELKQFISKLSTFVEPERNNRRKID